MALTQQVREAFDGDPRLTTLIAGKRIGRFYNSIAEAKTPGGYWWVYIPNHQISQPGTSPTDIRNYIRTQSQEGGLKKNAREILAIKEEWSDMKAWCQVILTAPITCYMGKAAAQGNLPGGWTQIYLENPDIKGKYNNVQSIELK